MVPRRLGIGRGLRGAELDAGSEHAFGMGWDSRSDSRFLARTAAWVGMTSPT